MTLSTRAKVKFTMDDRKLRIKTLHNGEWKDVSFDAMIDVVATLCENDTIVDLPADCYLATPRS